MKENFRAVEFLFKKMKSLYSTFQYPDEFGIELWTEILEGYSQTELLDALKAYRKQTVYNKAPTPAEFRKFLEAIKSNDRANMRQRIEKCAAEIEDKFGVKARNRYIRGLIDAYGVELKPETEEKKKNGNSESCGDVYATRYCAWQVSASVADVSTGGKLHLDRFVEP